MKVILFKNARLKGNEELVDLLVENGVYKEIGPDLSQKYKDIETYDLEGNLVVPPYVDPHIHLDYVYTARMAGANNGTGTLFEGIQRWSETKSNMTKDEIKDRARIALKGDFIWDSIY